MFVIILLIYSDMIFYFITVLFVECLLRRLQRKLRRKPTVGGVVNKLTLSRLAPKRLVVTESINESLTSGDDVDRNDWQDISSAT